MIGPATSRFASAILPALLLLVACAGEEEVPAEPTWNLVMSGADQTGTVGEPLAQPITITLERADGSSAVSFPLRITTVSGSLGIGVPGRGSVGGDGATLNIMSTDGAVELRVTLGPTPGPQTFELRAPGMRLSQPVTLVELTAGPGPVAHVFRIGDARTGAPGEPLDIGLVIRDRFENPIEGIEVHWTPAAGVATPAASTSDASGRAITAWTLPQDEGVHTLDVEIAGIGMFRFQATAVNTENTDS